MQIESSKALNTIKWIGKHISSPEQRMLMGATALATQPFIDLNNKEVDEDTRMISVARTLAKIIAGTVVGVAVRYGAIKLIKKYAGEITKDMCKFITPYNQAEKKIASIAVDKKARAKFPIMPSDEVLTRCLYKRTFDEATRRYGNYIKAFGTIIATLAMVFTNFAIDAPLTRLLTRKFHGLIVKDKKIDKKEAK